MFVSLTKTTQAFYISLFMYVFALVLVGGVVIPSFLAEGNDS
jgi:hypothetical protein